MSTEVKDQVTENTNEKTNEEFEMVLTKFRANRQPGKDAPITYINPTNKEDKPFVEVWRKVHNVSRIVILSSQSQSPYDDYRCIYNLKKMATSTGYVATLTDMQKDEVTALIKDSELYFKVGSEVIYKARYTEIAKMQTLSFFTNSISNPRKRRYFVGKSIKQEEAAQIVGELFKKLSTQKSMKEQTIFNFLTKPDKK